jgi:hypothetical protein
MNIIFGFDRSGTSYVANKLKKSGLNPGIKLLPPDSNNINGYIEDIDIVTLNQKIIELDKNSSGINFERNYKNINELIKFKSKFFNINLIKDPRIIKLSNYYMRYAKEEDAAVHFVTRNPELIANSLNRIYGTRNEEVLNDILESYLNFYQLIKENNIIPIIHDLRSSTNDVFNHHLNGDINNILEKILACK